MRQAQINVRTRACSRTSIARTKQAALTHNVRGKELMWYDYRHRIRFFCFCCCYCNCNAEYCYSKNSFTTATTTAGLPLPSHHHHHKQNNITNNNQCSAQDWKRAWCWLRKKGTFVREIYILWALSRAKLNFFKGTFARGFIFWGHIAHILGNTSYVWNET